jgi:hypothetical protein
MQASLQSAPDFLACIWHPCTFELPFESDFWVSFIPGQQRIIQLSSMIK